MFNSWFAADRPQEVRETAVNLANKTALRRNPEVRKALAAYIDHETSFPEVAAIASKTSSTATTRSTAQQLRQADHRTRSARREADARRSRIPTDDFVADILHFRDYVFAEMTKINCEDNKACISCHGVPGRVPTLYLEARRTRRGTSRPTSCSTTTAKCSNASSLRDVEQSKFLRKPLNIQTGEEDGHQGGQRYEAEDAGYQVIQQWVLKQAELQRVAVN